METIRAVFKCFLAPGKTGSGTEQKKASKHLTIDIFLYHDTIMVSFGG